MTTSATESWQAESYPSGTHVVTRADSTLPHLYVYGPHVIDEMDEAALRRRMCLQLAAYLNGDPIPVWLRDMERVSETKLLGPDGSAVVAVGPMFDANPPRLQWQERDDDASRDARARLIDSLTRRHQ